MGYMPRKPRISIAGGIHHVVNRCNRRAHLLSKEDLQDCCSLLLETKRRFSLRLFAYAFLHNHYHLVAQEPVPGTMSLAMRWFNGSVAVRHNTRHQTTGHLWQGRFKNRLLENNERDFLQCLLYVDLNPARAGLAPALTNWAFSSTRAHAEGAEDPLLDPSPISLGKYREMLQWEWMRTQQLLQALEARNREATRVWLRQATSRTFISCQKEIAVLLGRNFRRLLKKSPADQFRLPGDPSA